ncbi:MAG: hypothetical protein KAJ14_13455, partial [Candidatus Omnitrophica bacterium]|nr:hypothetical protein [Candidatus Omnitrophota bacterium]
IQKLREIKEISNNLQEAVGSVENEVIKEKVDLSKLEEEVKLVETNIKEQEDRMASLVKERRRWRLQEKELVKTRKELKLGEDQIKSLEEKINNLDREIIKEMARRTKFGEAVKAIEKSINEKESRNASLEKDQKEIGVQGKEIIKVEEELSIEAGRGENLEEEINGIDRDIINEMAWFKKIEEESIVLAKGLNQRDNRKAELKKEKIEIEFRVKEIIQSGDYLKSVKAKVQRQEKGIKGVKDKIISFEQESKGIEKDISFLKNKILKIQKEKSKRINEIDMLKGLQKGQEKEYETIVINGSGLEEKIRISIEKEMREQEGTGSIEIEEELIPTKVQDIYIIWKIEKQKADKIEEKMRIKEKEILGKSKSLVTLDKKLVLFYKQEEVKKDEYRELLNSNHQMEKVLSDLIKSKAETELIAKGLGNKKEELRKKEAAIHVLEKDIKVANRAINKDRARLKILVSEVKVRETSLKGKEVIKGRLGKDKIFIEDKIKALRQRIEGLRDQYLKAKTLEEEISSRERELFKERSRLQKLEEEVKLINIAIEEKEKIKISLVKDKSYLKGQVEKLEKLNNDLAMTVAQGKELEKGIEFWGVESFKDKAGLDNLNEKIKFLSKSIKEKEKQKASLEQEKLAMKAQEKAVTPTGQDWGGVEAKRENLEHELGLVHIDIIKEKAEINRLEEKIRGLEENISQQESNKLILENDKIKVGYQEQELTKINKELRTLEDRISNLKDEITKKEKISQRED